MKNTPFEGDRLTKKAKQRLHQVIREELTPVQREVLLAYYFQEMTIPQIAADRGVNKSTVSRTLKRAENRLQRCLRY